MGKGHGGLWHAARALTLAGFAGLLALVIVADDPPVALWLIAWAAAVTGTVVEGLVTRSLRDQLVWIAALILAAIGTAISGALGVVLMVLAVVAAILGATLSREAAERRTSPPASA